VCRNCHKVISVDPDVLASVSERLAADHGFTIDVGHLTVFGICGDHS
jgi:Fur family transcriptional regulator, ferric uptake regulator